MRDSLEAHISAKRLLKRDHRLLLAVSGGADSIVMTQLLHALGYDITLAHCNYKLRGADSDKDEQFCRTLAKKLGCGFFSEEMKLTARRSEQSLQEEARALRYAWLESVRTSNKLDLILTAHHADDQAETVLLNLIRGTGLRGLRGISEKEGCIVRPLLPFSRQEILQYAKKNGIAFRTDISNSSTKYRRNFIRLKVLPLLNQVNPSLTETLSGNARRFAGEYKVLAKALEESMDRVISSNKDSLFVSVPKLVREPSPETLLHHLLAPAAFTSSQIRDIAAAAAAPAKTGKVFFSRSHILTIDRTNLVLKVKDPTTEEPVECHSFEDLKKLPFLKVSSASGIKAMKQQELLIEKDAFRLPVTIRPPAPGDRMVPFGMKGSKLVSDVLREKKLNLFEKKKVRVLVNGNGEIIWLMGIRSDDRYRVQDPSNKLIKLTYLEQS